MPKKTVKAEVDKVEEAAKVVAKKAEIDKEFQDTVAKAAEERNAKLAKLPITPGTNIAEQAWNETKADEDPVYGACAFEHRAKLDTAVDSIKRSGSADIAGLEDFEVRVKELLAEVDSTTKPTALVPADSAGRPAE